MNTKPVTLVVTFQARPGKETELCKALLGLLAPTRKEAGCINYDLHSAPDDPAKFLFYENWTSQAHLDAHIQTPHVQYLQSRAGELCAEPLKLSFGKRLAEGGALFRSDWKSCARERERCEFADEFLNLLRRENFSFALQLN